MIVLPILSIYWFIMTPVGLNITDFTILQILTTMQRWAEAQTIPIWLPLYLFGVDLGGPIYQSKDLWGWLFLAQWLMMPVNLGLFALPTIIFFPISLLCAIYTFLAPYF